MLIVVKNRNVEFIAQPAFDDEAFRRLDVFEVYAPEGRTDIADGRDQFFDVLCGHFDVDRIDIGEALEQDGLALHYRLGGKRAEIAHAQDRGAVGDNGDQIPLGGVIVGLLRVVRDRLDRHGHAWRISQRKIALRGHRLSRRDRQFAWLRQAVKRQRFFVGKGAFFVCHQGTRQN